MSRNLKHLAALSLIAHSHEELHPNELSFLKSVAKRLKIDNKTAVEIIEHPEHQSHDLPAQEIDRYVFLDDVLKLLIADGALDEAEIEQCRLMCSKLGFEKRMVDGIIRKMSKHIERGFDKNKITEALSHDLNRLTSKITKYDRHS